MLGIQQKLSKKNTVLGLPRTIKLEHATANKLGWQALLFSGSAVILSTLVMFVSGTAAYNVNMVFMLVTLLATVWFGLAAGSITAIFSFFCFNYFFIPPLFTFAIDAAHGWLAVFLFFGTALLANQIAGRARLNSYLATKRAQEASVLYEMATAVLTKVEQAEMLKLVLQKVTQALDTTSCTLYLLQATVNSEKLVESCRVENSKHNYALPQPDLAMAQAAFDKNQAIFLASQTTTSTRSNDSKEVGPDLAVTGPVAYVPLGYGSVVLGVIVLGGIAQLGNLEFNAEEKRIIQVIAKHIALAVEHARLIQEAALVATLRDSDKLKTALLDSVSHELRTPLTSIKTATANLAAKDIVWSHEEHAEFLDLIEQETNRLIKLVNNILELSKIEAGVLKPQWGWYYLPEIVEQVVDRLKYNPLVQEHPIQTSFAADLPHLRLDYLQIDQVLTNLLDNAAKYSPAGSPIQVQVELVPANQLGSLALPKSSNAAELPELAFAQPMMVVKVVDEGRGIPHELLTRVFDKFYRVQVTTENLIMDAPGTGIGLAISKGIIEAHKGFIWAQNRLDGGTIFQFALPVTSPAQEGILSDIGDADNIERILPTNDE